MPRKPDQRLSARGQNGSQMRRYAAQRLAIQQRANQKRDKFKGLAIPFFGGAILIFIAFLLMGTGHT